MKAIINHITSGRTFFYNSLVLLFAVLFLHYSAMAQDASFSQYYLNRMYYNPAYTGIENTLSVNMHYRNQWNKLSTRFDNYTLSIDAAEPNLPGSGGIGLIIQSDMDGIGNIKTTSATLATSVKILMSENLLTQFGMNVGFVRKTVNWDNLIFSDQIDPRTGLNGSSSAFLQPDFNSINYPDVGTGILLRYCEETDVIRNVVGTVSVSVQHVFQPNISFYQDDANLPIKLVVMGDVLLDNIHGTTTRYDPKTPKFKINPGFFYEQQGRMSNFMLGVTGYKSYIYSGIWFRNQSFTMAEMKDIVFMLGAYIPFGNDSRIKIRYSYDYLLSDIRRIAGTTHEFSVIYELDGFSFFGMPKNDRRSRFTRPDQSCLHCGPF
jgi:type IX secretion system PorP/SprF family membrane protein